MDAVRKIIHVDMDAFFASVEQRNNPQLRGKPVVVGGRPDSRSVVAAASYEARKFGIRSAMPCSQAFRLCPQAVFVPPNFEAYKLVSSQVMGIFHEFTDLVEPLSLDEAYLDVTENKIASPSATRVAESIRKRIFDETGLTASAGVASTKFLAKIASDMNKPDGLTVIPPERVENVLLQLPVRAIPGIGPKTAERMKVLGIETVAQLREYSKDDLERLFGRTGAWYYHVSRGEDNRPVRSDHERKSVGAEDTFSIDLLDYEALESELRKIAMRVWKRLAGKPGRTITVKVTYAGFEKCTRSQTLEEPLDTEEQLLNIAIQLLLATEATKRPIRLLGISVANFRSVESIRPSGSANQLEFPWGAHFKEVSNRP